MFPFTTQTKVELVRAALMDGSIADTNLSTAMATRVKTDADTDTPCTKPLILHTVLEKGQPVKTRVKQFKGR